jgi:hypothetical protein
MFFFLTDGLYHERTNFKLLLIQSRGSIQPIVSNSKVEAGAAPSMYNFPVLKVRERSRTMFCESVHLNKQRTLSVNVLISRQTAHRYQGCSIFNMLLLIKIPDYTLSNKAEVV